MDDLQPDSISWHTRAVASWDLGTLAYLGLVWVLIGQTDARVTRDHALGQDQSGYVIFLLVVGAACASTIAIGFVAGTIRDLPFWARTWHLTLTITALVSSWLLIQTVFAFHTPTATTPRRAVSPRPPPPSSFRAAASPTTWISRTTRSWSG
jgi:uncharacterized membrane protein